MFARWQTKIISIIFIFKPMTHVYCNLKILNYEFLNTQYCENGLRNVKHPSDFSLWKYLLCVILSSPISRGR